MPSHFLINTGHKTESLIRFDSGEFFAKTRGDPQAGNGGNPFRIFPKMNQQRLRKKAGVCRDVRGKHLILDPQPRDVMDLFQRFGNLLFPRVLQTRAKGG